MNERLLIIDDNAAVRATLKLLLRDEFQEVTAIGNPTEISSLPRPGGYDTVMLDMNFDSGALDCSDGLFWLERIKELPNPPAVVVITAFGDIEVAVNAMKLGAEDFITKPWDNDELIEKLRNAIAVNRRQSRDKAAARRASELEEAEKDSLTLSLDEVKIRHIRKVIDSCGGNLSAAAVQLGVNRQTLYNILKKQ